MSDARLPRRRLFLADNATVLRAQEFRRNMTFTEVLLWKRLRKRQVGGYLFHRQKPIHRFIVDFFAPDLRLAIEIDGPVHEKTKERDLDRQRYLENLDIKVLRFTEEDVHRDIDRVVATITEDVRSRARLLGLCRSAGP